jgi:hypothetical protein
MKRILLVLGVLLGFVVTSQAQITLDNQTGCDLKIWVVCVDQNCNVVNETPYDVNAGDNINVPDCPAPLQTYFLVQNNDPTCPWSSGLLSILIPPPPNPCIPQLGNVTLLPAMFLPPSFPCSCSPGGINIQYTGGVLSIF